jgi:hypothetical protein|tara:strand:- start:1183 stop:1407 length:225 start_codon:yes stop_codon:yes gene_type:complete
MTDISMFTFYMIWGSCGLAMAISFMFGKASGYKQLHFQITDTILDIQLESEKVSLMKKEILELQSEINEVKEEK